MCLFEAERKEEESMTDPDSCIARCLPSCDRIKSSHSPPPVKGASRVRARYDRTISYAVLASETEIEKDSAATGFRIFFEEFMVNLLRLPTLAHVSHCRRIRTSRPPGRTW